MKCKLQYLINLSIIDHAYWQRCIEEYFAKRHLVARWWVANNGRLCFIKTLQWRHNGRYSVLNHQPHDCLLNRLFRRRSKKTQKLRVTGLCEGNSPGAGDGVSLVSLESGLYFVSFTAMLYGISPFEPRYRGTRPYIGQAYKLVVIYL